MRAKFLREVARAVAATEPPDLTLVTEQDLALLPKSAQRYMRFMEVVGRPRHWSFRAHLTGMFRMGPSKPWMPCETWQYNTRLGVTRIFHMRVRFGGIVPVYVRDNYVGGHGRMLGRAFDVFPMVDDQSEKISTGELVTYLNDAILFAPSMLLGEQALWTEVDDDIFDVAITDHGRTVQGRVYLDDDGAVNDFSTSDRFATDPEGGKDLVRTRWSTPVRGWFAGREGPRATGGKAIWHHPTGDLEYADLTFAPDSVEYDVPADIGPNGV